MADCSLSLDNLCVKCGRICWLKSKYITVEDLNLNNLCAQKINSKEVNSATANLNKLCVQEAIINKLCVNDLSAPNLKICNKYRFYIGFTTDFLYSLGADMNFNLISDDPNSNISVSPNTFYTVPVAGYYTLSLFVNSFNLTGSGVITGTPVSQLSVKVNGTLRKETVAPFLAFNLSQKVTITAHLYLAAGDKVEVNYNVLVMDATLGLIPYVGTVMLKGGAVSFDESSTWDMVLLTELCGGSSVTCAPCVPAVISCEPVPADQTCVAPTPPPAMPCTFDCK